jgi:hypothetical protein
MPGVTRIAVPSAMGLERLATALDAVARRSAGVMEAAT